MSSIRLQPIALTVLLAIGCVCGCGSPHASDAPFRTMVDAHGMEIRFPLEVHRIATLAPGVTEMVVAAGGLESIVGVTTADNFPPEIQNLPSFSALPVNFEAVASLEPDLVLGIDQVNDYRDVGVFENIGIPALYLTSRTIENVLSSIETIGEILGTHTRTSLVVDSLMQRIDSLESRARGLPKPTVLFLVSAGTLHSFGPESYVHDLIALAGGQSITEGMSVENPILSDEFVLSRAPEVIVGTFGPDFTVTDLLAEHPTWGLLPAVINDRVYTVDGDLFLRAGPRIIEGAELLARLVHPMEAR